MANVTLVEPPLQTRGREPSIDQATLTEMASLCEKGWATNGETYKDAKQARYEAGRYKKYVSRLQDDLKIKSRVWQDGNSWVFALHGEKP